MKRQIRTYQTRYKTTQENLEILTQYAFVMSSVERKIFAKIMSGKDLNDLKREYISKYQITARQFNSCKIQTQGKIKSYKEKREEDIALLKAKIVKLDKYITKKSKQIKKLKESKKSWLFKLHNMKRRLFNLRKKYENLIKEKKENKIKICFGSKKLFRSQFNLEENGYKTHEQWLSYWKDKRNSSFFIVGSKEESKGNQTCQIQLQEDGKFSLHLRLPNSFSLKKIILENIDFSYGKKEILAAIENNQKRKQCKKASLPFKDLGQAINYRFLRDEKGFRIFVTFDLPQHKYISNKNLGVIGVDINVDHLAITETDRFGNPIKSEKIPLCTYGKKTNRTKALIGDAIAKIVDLAISSQKPLVVENLDFKNKKRTLSGSGKKCRMFSSFSYKTILAFIHSRAWQNKIEVIEVNPAYTSVIGRVKFAKMYGFSVHQAAALVIGRRGMKLSEKPPRDWVMIPGLNGCIVAFFPPVRMWKKHVWSFWWQVCTKLKTTDAPYSWAKFRSLSGQSAFVTKILENWGRDSLTLNVVGKTAWSTFLGKFRMCRFV